MSTPEPIMKQDQLEGATGFFEALFDFNFSKFVSLQLVKVLYILVMLLAGLGAVVLIIQGFASSLGSGLIALVFAPIVFIVWILVARVFLEIFVVIFRIEAVLKQIEDNTGE